MPSIQIRLRPTSFTPIPFYGVRPLKGVIQNKVQNVLAMKLLNGEIKEGDKVTVDVASPGGRLLDFKVKK